MGGSKAAPAPDYTPVGQANERAAEIAADVQREQLAWAKETYARDSARIDEIVGQFIGTSKTESEAAAADRERFKTTFQPLEDRLVRQALEYDTPQRQEYEAGRAAAEANAAMVQQRQGALAALESYGVDPSVARSAALDAGLRVAGAAAAAGAANQARVNTEATGRAMVGEAVNIGRGYPGQIAQGYATAQGAGQGAISGTLAGTQSGANTMGTAMQWAGVRNGALGNWGGNVASMNNSTTAANASMSNARTAMMGDIAGTAMGGAFRLAMSDPSMKKDMERVGEDSKSGIGIYAFRYKDAPANSPKVIGVNARDVAAKLPDAVVRIPRPGKRGVLAVDYSKLPASVRKYIAPVGRAAA